MKWQGRAGSANVEDRRGMRMGLPLGGGIGGIVLLLLYSALTGTNPIDIVNSGAPTEESAPTGVPANDQQAQFISVVLKSTEDVWSKVFASGVRATNRRCSCCSVTRPSRRAASASPRWAPSIAHGIGRYISTSPSSGTCPTVLARRVTSRAHTWWRMVGHQRADADRTL